MKLNANGRWLYKKSRKITVIVVEQIFVLNNKKTNILKSNSRVQRTFLRFAFYILKFIAFFLIATQLSNKH